MRSDSSIELWPNGEENNYLPHISLDCAVFGWHANELKILLLKMKGLDRLALPGGFVLREETLEEAAIRTLKERTGLEDIFLQQDYVLSAAQGRDRQHRA